MNEDLAPLKVVVAELGLSRTSLWRAMASDIPNFPKPERIRGRLYWPRSSFERLEEALLLYRGRTAFEAKRRSDKTHAALRAAKRTQKPAPPQPAPTGQLDLFASSERR